MRLWFRIAVVVLVVISGVATPAFAQPEVGGDNSTTPTPNESDIGTTTGNESGNESNESGNTSAGTSSGGGGGGGGLGGLMPSVPGPGDWLEGALGWLGEDVQNGLGGYVDALNSVFVGMAAPGEETSPTSWFMPDSGMWSIAGGFYVAMASMASVVWGMGIIYLFDTNNRQKQREILRTLVYSGLATLVGMVLLGLWFNGWDIIVRAVAPSGNEFVHTGEGLAQLGLGHAIVAILLYANAGIVVLGGIIMFGIYLLPLVLFAFFPLLVASKSVPAKSLQSTANLGLTTLVMLPVLRFIQALLLRLASMLTWEGTGLGEQIASLFGTAIILTIALLVLPYMFYKNIETASGMALSTITVKKANQGAAKVNDGATAAGSRLKGRAKSTAKPHVDRARSAVSEKASNAKRRVGSRAGGAMLDAKFGRSGSSGSQTSRRSPGSGSSADRSSASTSGGSRSKMPEQPRARSEGQQRSINRQRRNAKKRRQHNQRQKQRSTRSDD